MKTFQFNFVLFLSLFAFSHSSVGQIEDGPKIEFSEEVYDFGEVTFGGDATHTFTLVNTGNEALIINQAKGSCQCTVADYPKEPIAPGEEGTITVKYNSKRSGPINKSVTISSNALNDPTKIIRIKGNVLPQPEQSIPVNPVGPSLD